MQKGIIEVAPIAFMRGRTLNDSFVILDEAQNTTSEQMKMFLTRIGFNSKAVITGDITQIDLPAEELPGLIESKDILQGIDGIRFVFFSKKDVVRHKLVQNIIQAYEELEARKQKKEFPLSGLGLIKPGDDSKSRIAAVKMTKEKNKESVGRFIATDNRFRWVILSSVTILFSVMLFPNLVVTRHQ